MCKWVVVSIEEKVAKNNTISKVRLHRDILSVTPAQTGELRVVRPHAMAVLVLIKFLCLVKHIAFYLTLGLYEMQSSINVKFLSSYKE